MTFRSLVLSTTLLLAFVARGTEAGFFRRRLSEDVELDDVEIVASEAEVMEAMEAASEFEIQDDFDSIAQLPEDEIPEEEIAVEEIVVPEEPEFYPLGPITSEEEAVEEELVMLANQYEQTMIELASLQDQALYEQEKAMHSSENDEENELAAALATQILSDVAVAEEEVEGMEAAIQADLEALVAQGEEESESRGRKLAEQRRKLEVQDSHVQNMIQEMQGTAEAHRRSLLEAMASHGKKSATLNGVTYEVEN